jgi:ribonuclease D
MTWTFIDQVSGAEQVVSALESCERIAVDTEFHPERRRMPELYLVAIGSKEGSWLIDPTVPGVLEYMGEALRDKVWVLHGGRHDLPLLESRIGLPKRTIDTQILYGLCTPVFPARLEQALTGEPHARQIGETMSDWSHRPLQPRQLAYAAADVLPLIPLASQLEASVAHLGRSEHARAAMEEAMAAALSPPATQPHEIRGRHALSPREAAALDELIWWRDQEAGRRGTAPAAVIGDGHLLDLAKRQPLSIEAIAHNRRFPTRIAQRHGEAIVDLMLRLQQRRPDRLPVTAPPGSEREARQAWWRAQALLEGRRAHWSAQLLLPDPLLVRVADGLDLDGWRWELLADWVGELREQEP